MYGIEHPILNAVMNEQSIIKRHRVERKEARIIRLTAAESTWGEEADHVSAMIATEKRELKTLIANL